MIASASKNAFFFYLISNPYLDTLFIWQQYNNILLRKYNCFKILSHSHDTLRDHPERPEVSRYRALFLKANTIIYIVIRGDEKENEAATRTSFSGEENVVSDRKRATAVAPRSRRSRRKGRRRKRWWMSRNRGVIRSVDASIAISDYPTRDRRWSPGHVQAPIYTWYIHAHTVHSAIPPPFRGHYARTKALFSPPPTYASTLSPPPTFFPLFLYLSLFLILMCTYYLAYRRECERTYGRSGRPTMAGVFKNVRSGVASRPFQRIAI